MKILGTNNDVTTCECCGKANLKKTVAIDNGGGVVHYGVSCAARAMKATQLYVKQAAREADRNPARPARQCWGVLNVATGRVVSTYSTRPEAEQGAACRGAGYEVVNV